MANQTATGDLGIVLSEVDPTRLLVLSLITGQVLGTLPIGPYPMVALRPSRSEILVSDGTKPLAHLAVIDAKTLSTKWTVPLPDRSEYTLFSLGMRLARNERYLYYLKHTPCEPGPFCDDYGIGIVDLDAGVEIAAATLPRNSGFGWITLTDETNVAIMCPRTGDVWEVAPTGDATLLGHFPRFPLESIGGRGYLAWPVGGGAIDDGRCYMIFEDGTIQIHDATGGLAYSGKINITDGGRFNGAWRWDRGDGRIVLGIWNPHDQDHEAIAGAVRFDPRRPDMIQPLKLPRGTEYLAPLAGDMAAAIHDGKVSTIDARIGAIMAGPFDLPAGADVVISSPVFHVF